MDIFKDLKQAVRFAFALEQYRDSRTGATTAVRQALVDVGINATPAQLEATPPAVIGEYGYQILLQIHGKLLKVEAAALTAAYSRDWEGRRAAVDLLTPHFYYPLARIADNKRLVDKLVTRHYIAHRERGAGWDIASLSQEFKTPKSRITRAAQIVEHCARQIETMALNTLREALGLPDPAKATLRANVNEHHAAL